MAKVTLPRIVDSIENPTNEISQILEVAVKNTLPRDGARPMVMEADLDLANHKIGNVSPSKEAGDVISRKEARDYLGWLGTDHGHVTTSNGAKLGTSEPHDLEDDLDVSLDVTKLSAGTVEAITNASTLMAQNSTIAAKSFTFPQLNDLMAHQLQWIQPADTTSGSRLITQHTDMPNKSVSEFTFSFWLHLPSPRPNPTEMIFKSGSHYSVVNVSNKLNLSIGAWVNNNNVLVVKSYWMKTDSASQNSSELLVSGKFTDSSLALDRTYHIMCSGRTYANPAYDPSATSGNERYTHIMYQDLWVDGVLNDREPHNPAEGLSYTNFPYLSFTEQFCIGDHGVDDLQDDNDEVVYSYTKRLQAKISEFYFTDTYIDLTVQANRDKFYKDGNPVFLGQRGEKPTDSIPRIYFGNYETADTGGLKLHREALGWNGGANKGTVGDWISDRGSWVDYAAVGYDGTTSPDSTPLPAFVAYAPNWVSPAATQSRVITETTGLAHATVSEMTLSLWWHSPTMEEAGLANATYPYTTSEKNTYNDYLDNASLFELGAPNPGYQSATRDHGFYLSLTGRQYMTGAYETGAADRSNQRHSHIRTLHQQGQNRFRLQPDTVYHYLVTVKITPNGGDSLHTIEVDSYLNDIITQKLGVLGSNETLPYDYFQTIVSPCLELTSGVTIGSLGTSSASTASRILNAKDTAMVGKITEVWFDDSYMDIRAEVNRRKFSTRNPQGIMQPISLGARGGTPTGSTPLVYFGGNMTASTGGIASNGDGDGWNGGANLGTMSGFTSNFDDWTD